MKSNLKNTKVGNKAKIVQPTKKIVSSVNRTSVFREKAFEELNESNDSNESNESDEEDSESLEDSDSDAEMLTHGVDLQIHKTLLAIKNKDPIIYDKQKEFFGMVMRSR